MIAVGPNSDSEDSASKWPEARAGAGGVRVVMEDGGEPFE